MLPFAELAISGHASANRLRYFDVRMFGTRNKCETPTRFNVPICNDEVYGLGPACEMSTHQLVNSIGGVYCDNDSPDNRTSPLKLGICTVPAQIQWIQRGSASLIH